MGRKPTDLFGEISSVHAEMQRMLEDMLRPPGRRPLVPGRGWQPATDVYRTPSHLVVRMEIAGVSPKNVQIHYERGHLLIQGFRLEDPSEEKESVHQMEIGYGQFERVIHVPENVDAEKHESEYAEGFLLIKLPLRASDPKNVPID